MEPRTFPELASLQCQRLESNADFQALKRQLQTHLEEGQLPIAARTQHKGKSVAWRQVLYSALSDSLREVVLTQDTTLQLALLHKAKRWYWDKVAAVPPVSFQGISVSDGFRTFSTFHRSQQATRDQVARKKLDSVLSIESRSPRRSQASPARPEPVAIDYAHETRFPAFSPLKKDRKEQNLRKDERRALAMYRRQMEKWTKEPNIEEMSRRSSIGSVEQQPGPIRVNISLTEPRGASLTERSSPIKKRGPKSPSPLRKTFYSMRGNEGSMPEDAPLEWETKVAEVEDIKRKFAFSGLQCTYRTLTTALVEPRTLISSLLTPASLPRGDERLLANPFFDPGNKRKKK